MLLKRSRWDPQPIDFGLISISHPRTAPMIAYAAELAKFGGSQSSRATFSQHEPLVESGQSFKNGLDRRVQFRIVDGVHGRLSKG